MRRSLVAAAAALLTLPLVVEGQDWKTVTMSQRLDGEDDVRVSVRYGAGLFSIRSVDGGLLYRMHLEYDEDRFEPLAEYSGNRLELGVETRRRGLDIDTDEAGELRLELARGIPMDLSLIHI